MFFGLRRIDRFGSAGFCHILLMGNKADAAVTEELDGQIAAFKELVNRPVHPGTEK